MLNKLIWWLILIALLFNESTLSSLVNLELLPLNFCFEFIYVKLFCLYFFHASTWYILEEELEPIKRGEL